MTSDQKQYWVAYTDGASRGNPGLAGCGVFILAPDGTEHEVKEFLGHATNNQAEYKALVIALAELARLKADHVLVRADSELMVRQMLGQYRVKNEGILPLYREAKGLSTSFQSISYEHVRREQNKAADRLANEAIDERNL